MSLKFVTIFSFWNALWPTQLALTTWLGVLLCTGKPSWYIT